MATVYMTSGAAAAAAGAESGSEQSYSRGPRFIAETFDGADEALAALDAIQGNLVSTGFQTLDYLTVLYEELASSHHAMPRLVVVTERNSGEVALALPLIIQKERKLNVARFADFGVAGYSAPILGKVPLEKRRSIRRAWRAILHVMPDVDLIRLKHMPVEIGGRLNPLLTRRGITLSRHPNSILTVPETIEAYLAARGKKYRRDVERSYRLWEKEPSPRFYRATMPEEIARVYSILEEQQAAQRDSHHGESIFDEPAHRAFHERLAFDGSDAGLASLFALEAGGEIVATLFGIVHDGTFTLLRMSTDRREWGYLSPGRLIIIEAMKHFVERGVRRFDLGVGDDPFIRSFGVEHVPLYDLIVARDLTVVPRAMFHRLKGWLRRTRHTRSASQHFKPHFAR